MVFLMAIPSNMEVGMPESAIMGVDEDSREAIPKPALAVIAESAMPGMMEGEDGGGNGVSCFVEEVENRDEQIENELCML